MVPSRFVSASLQFGQQIDAVLCEATELDWGDICQRLAMIEASTSSAVKEDASLVIETKRRIQQSLLQAAYIKKRSFEEKRTLFYALQRLGFAHLEFQLEETIIYATNCAEFGQAAEGLRALNELLDECRSNLSKKGKEAATLLQETIQRMHDRHS